MKATATKKAKGLTLQQRIDLNNAAYEKATPAQRRVMIAKDALEQIKQGKFEPTTGWYVSVRSEEPIEHCDPLQPFLLDTEHPVSCRCCAKGAMFLSCVRLSNQFNGQPTGIGSQTINALVQWPETNYNRIEAAFEGYDGGERGGAYGKWRKKYPLASVRLKKILNNIVRNKGTFKFNDL